MSECHWLTGQFYIYTLTDPRDNSVRYVGLTRWPEQRRGQHRYAPSKTPLGEWLDELSAVGLAPIFTVIEEVIGCHEGRDCEKNWIKHYQAIRPILNQTCGRKPKRPPLVDGNATPPRPLEEATRS